MKRDDNDRKRRFRSYTVNFSSQKARTTIITMGLSIAVFAIIICVVAVQLISSSGKVGMAGRILHSISADSLRSVMAEQIPMYEALTPKHTPTLEETRVKPKGFANMALYIMTDIDASNPLTLLGFQIPGMAVLDYQLLTPHTKDVTPPAVDHAATPPNIDLKPREKVVVEEPKASDKPQVYMYFTHNRESFLPELKGVDNADLAYDAKNNIEKAGTWLINGLKEEGILGMQTLEDYWMYNDFDNSYQYSRKTVQKVLEEHKDLKLIFDIHRDSRKREVTTRKVNGQDYATVYFIIGGDNPNSAKNAEVAKKLHEYMQKMYPGLSLGVWLKPANPNYDTRYNQDLNPNMVLLEFGGPWNSLEEIKRTSEAMAKVSAAYLKDVEKLLPEVKEQSATQPAPPVGQQATK
jgi:stage II sporulation protein P